MKNPLKKYPELLTHCKLFSEGNLALETEFMFYVLPSCIIFFFERGVYVHPTKVLIIKERPVPIIQIYKVYVLPCCVIYIKRFSKGGLMFYNLPKYQKNDK